MKHNRASSPNKKVKRKLHQMEFLDANPRVPMAGGGSDTAGCSGSSLGVQGTGIA